MVLVVAEVILDVVDYTLELLFTQWTLGLHSGPFNEAREAKGVEAAVSERFIS